MNDIKKGDAYWIPITIAFDGLKIEPSHCTDIEVCFDKLRKTLKNNDVVYCDSPGSWKFYLTQEETFTFSVGTVSYQVRVHFVDGTVRGSDIGTVTIGKTISKEVLTDD